MVTIATNDETKTIVFARGDTQNITITLTDAETGAAFDLTGYSATLTVNSEQNPSDVTNELFSVAGSIATPTNGEITFKPSSTDTDQTPADHYYDLQLDGNGNRITVLKGIFKIVQDINKS